jgi:hypothetical protein
VLVRLFAFVPQENSYFRLTTRWNKHWGKISKDEWEPRVLFSFLD